MLGDPVQIEMLWFPWNLYVPVLNFLVDLLSLAITSRLFVRAALSGRFLSKLGFLTIDVSIGLMLFFVNVWFSAMLLSSAFAFSFPETDTVMNLNMLFLFLKYETGSVGLYVVENYPTIGAYVIGPLLAGLEYFAKLGEGSTLRNPLFLACMLLSITSMIPTLLHI